MSGSRPSEVSIQIDSATSTNTAPSQAPSILDANKVSKNNPALKLASITMSVKSAENPALKPASNTASVKPEEAPVIIKPAVGRALPIDIYKYEGGYEGFLGYTTLNSHDPFPVSEEDKAVLSQVQQAYKAKHPQAQYFKLASEGRVFDLISLQYRDRGCMLAADKDKIQIPSGFDFTYRTGALVPTFFTTKKAYDAAVEQKLKPTEAKKPSKSRFLCSIM